jgi:hypothetical protein
MCILVPLSRPRVCRPEAKAFCLCSRAGAVYLDKDLLINSMFASTDDRLPGSSQYLTYNYPYLLEPTIAVPTPSRVLSGARTEKVAREGTGTFDPGSKRYAYRKARLEKVCALSSRGLVGSRHDRCSPDFPRQFRKTTEYHFACR